MKRARSQVRRLAWVLAAGVALVSPAGADSGLSSYAHAEKAANAISALDFDEARSELAKGDAGDVNVAAETGRLAIYEGRCDDALVALGRPDLLKTEEGAALYEIARGCTRVIAATVTEVDEAHDVVVRYQDESDRALTPLLVETVVAAREALTRDLGVSWPKPTRVIVVRDLLSLSAMTGLPLKSAQTTGTVAVAKWGRVTLLSPRASEHGFAWRDTLAHELTHLAVTRASGEHAPLWLQEGMAKREEVRWRPPGPFDDRPSPDAVAIAGLDLKLGLPLDQLGPSIAMLPTPEAAMVAFAEVTSFVRYFAREGGPEALPRLLLALRANSNVDAALREASGADLHAWDGRWREALAHAPHEPLPAAFGLGKEPTDLREVRDRLRLAELLDARNHPAPALHELDQVKNGSGKDDSTVRSLRAHTLRLLDRKPEAAAEVEDPKTVTSSFAPFWAIRGLGEREGGYGDLAAESYTEAVGTDPFDVEAACESDPTVRERPDDDSLPETAARALCAAARAWQLPSGLE